MASQPPSRPSFAPRNWGGWLMAGSLWLLGRLPLRLGRAVVRPLGPLLRWTLSSRRRIAERNIQACFPELTAGEREVMLKKGFQSLARMLMETAWCWARAHRDHGDIADIEGLAHLHPDALGGRGCLVVTAHVTCLEMGARVFASSVPVKGIYRPLGNEVMEWYQNRGRLRYARGMIPKRDMRAAVRHLRQGGVLWYAPDQDFGPGQSAFAPFFGLSTATLLATHRLPRMTACKVVLMYPSFHADTGRYRVEVSAPLEDFPTRDADADLARINALLEAQVRKAPEQYWWIHRRFKTRPPGEPPFYGGQSRQNR